MVQLFSSSQLRAARALLNWSRAELSKHTDVSEPTLHRFENNVGEAEARTQSKIRRTLEQAGIEFLDNEGVRRRPEGLDVLEGPDGFSRFYDFVYEYLRNNGGAVCVNGVDEKLFAKYRLNAEVDAEFHRARMSELIKLRNDVAVRIIVQEGDYNFVASAYAKYRWQPKKYFSSTAFYVFGDCLTLITFDSYPAPKLLVIRSPVFAGAYRKQFQVAWDAAKAPPKQHY